MNTPNFANSIVASIRELGGEMLQHTAVVVGSTAIYLASPATARRPHDLDLSIPEDIYQQFRLLPSWQGAETTYRTKNILRNSKCDIGVGWGGMSHTALQKRSWQTPEGLHVANISSIYSWKRTRRANKDKRDAVAIYDQLHNTTLLPLHVMRHEAALLATCLPKPLRKQELLRLASHGLLASFTRNHPQQLHSRRSVQNLTTLEQSAGSLTQLAKMIGHVLTQTTIARLSIDEQEIALVALIYSDILHSPSSPPPPQLASTHSLVSGYAKANAQRIAVIVDEIQQDHGISDPISQAVLDSLA